MDSITVEPGEQINLILVDPALFAPGESAALSINGIDLGQTADINVNEQTGEMTANVYWAPAYPGTGTLTLTGIASGAHEDFLLVVTDPDAATGWHTVQTARGARKFSINDAVLAERLEVARHQCQQVLERAGYATTGVITQDWRLAHLMQTAHLVNLVSDKGNDDEGGTARPMDWNVTALLLGYKHKRGVL